MCNIDFKSHLVFTLWCIWCIDRFVVACSPAGLVIDTLSKCSKWRLSKKRGLVATRARNPRFLMPLFGHKTGFRARMNEIKSGIPCSGCDVCVKKAVRVKAAGRKSSSRRQLTPFFERTSISDNSTNCQPRIQDEILGKCRNVRMTWTTLSVFWWNPAVSHSSPFLRQSPFRTFRQKRQPRIQVELFDEFVEMEIV